MTPDLPPSLARVDHAVVRDIASWGIPTPSVRVRIGEMRTPGGYTARHVRVGEWDGQTVTLTRDVTGFLAPERYHIIAHERLHAATATVGAPGYGTAESVCHEEAAADAVSLDLTASLYWRGATTAAYPAAVKWLRLASSRATGAAWTAPTATAWRITFLRADVPGRAAIAARDPEACPTTEFTPEVTP